MWKLSSEAVVDLPTGGGVHGTIVAGDFLFGIT
jgi:hypothetical protein